LRWLALVCFFIATLVIKHSVNLAVNYEKIWSLLAALALINIIYFAISRWIKELSFISELVILHIHIIADLIFLTLILHYSGGIENPIYLFYLFHVIISSIILPGLIPIGFATFVVFLFASLIYLEYNQLIPHYCIFNSTLHENVVAIYLILIVFIITVYVTAYICSTFMQIYRNSKRQIDEQHRQLIELDKQKSQFFKFTSHELKAPLIAIKSSIDGLVKILSKRLDDKNLDLLKRASKRTAQMLDILKELLELSKNSLTAEKEKEEAVDVLLVLDQVIQRERPLGEEKNLTFNIQLVSERIIIQGQVNDFDKIFANLLTNAIRYTPRNGSITISSRVKGNILTINFQDSGIGIAEKDLSSIFKEFYRSENAKKVVSFGTGLGLPLVKQKVEYYKGTIEVQSNINSGSTFRINLPVLDINDEKYKESNSQ
jgi:signal transduction histidine kinase